MGNETHSCLSKSQRSPGIVWPGPSSSARLLTRRWSFCGGRPLPVAVGCSRLLSASATGCGPLPAAGRQLSAVDCCRLWLRHRRCRCHLALAASLCYTPRLAWLRSAARRAPHLPFIAHVRHTYSVLVLVLVFFCIAEWQCFAPRACIRCIRSASTLPGRV